jgi:transcriptional regulator with XRE-family HTH domain
MDCIQRTGHGQHLSGPSIRPVDPPTHPAHGRPCRAGADALVQAASPHRSTAASAQDADSLRRQQLAEFLRARREELKPDDVGLAPGGGRRRVRGLRRHEVASLAFVSLTWYTWLEQGRDIRVSPALLDAVAHALKLDDDAWRHVRRLAGAPVLDCAATQDFPDEGSDYDPDLLGLTDDLLPSPAALVTPAFDFVAWNNAYAKLLHDPAELPATRRNLLWSLFLNTSVRRRLTTWETETNTIVPHLRAQRAHHPNNERLQELLEELTSESEPFRKAWSRSSVAPLVNHIQVVEHPDVGRVRVRQEMFRPVDQRGPLIYVHAPVDEESRQRILRLISASEHDDAASVTAVR